MDIIGVAIMFFHSDAVSKPEEKVTLSNDLRIMAKELKDGGLSLVDFLARKTEIEEEHKTRTRNGFTWICVGFVFQFISTVLQAIVQ